MVRDDVRCSSSTSPVSGIPVHGQLRTSYKLLSRDRSSSSALVAAPARGIHVGEIVGAGTRGWSMPASSPVAARTRVTPTSSFLSIPLVLSPILVGLRSSVSQTYLGARLPTGVRLDSPRSPCHRKRGSLRSWRCLLLVSHSCPQRARRCRCAFLAPGPWRWARGPSSRETRR